MDLSRFLERLDEGAIRTKIGVEERFLQLGIERRVMEIIPQSRTIRELKFRGAKA